MADRVLLVRPPPTSHENFTENRFFGHQTGQGWLNHRGPCLREPFGGRPGIDSDFQRDRAHGGTGTGVSWTGIYIGGNIGGTWDNYRLGSFFEDVEVQQQFEENFDIEQRPDGGPTAFDSVFPNFPDADGDDGSIFGGAQIGAAKQWGHLVVGIEGDFDALSTSFHRSEEFFGTSSNRGLFSETTGIARREGSTDWNASVRLRLGYVPASRWQIYVTGGVAFADVEGSSDGIASTDFFGGKGEFVGNVLTENHSADCHVFTGWTAGTGIEWALNRWLSLGVEYRYSNFGGKTFDFHDNGTAIDPGETSVELSSHQATFRVNLHLCSLLGNH